MPTQTIPAPTRSNPILTISRFTNAKSDATPIEALTAPLREPDPDLYSFETILDTYADHQRGQKVRDYFSFSTWDGSHDLEGHQATTLLTLEYHLDAADDVRDALKEMEFAHYQIPTKANRQNVVLFAFPVIDPLNYSDTTRAASLIAAMVGVRGVVQNSWFYTYFFRFRDGPAVIYRDGKFVGREFLEEAAGIFVQMKDYVR